MDKTIKLLEKFLKNYTMEGTCGFWVQPDEDGGIPSVYIIFDLDWLKETQTNPDLIARRMRQGLKEDIKNWTGIEVSYVGSTAKKCDNTKDINESVSTYLRRRLSFEDMKQDIENLVDYELNPCEFSNIGDFVAEACDMLVYNYVEDLEASLQKISSREKDTLYYFLVDNFGNHLANVYKQRCVKGLKESKKRIIVTESQYKRIFEQKKSKLEVFQDLINNKLNYIRGFCDNSLSSEEYSGDVGFGSCDVVDTIDSIKVDEVNMMTGARTDMEGNTYDSTPSIYVKLTINFSNIKEYVDFDDMVYDLKHILRKSTGGLPIVLDYRTNNLNKNKEW
jgi:hypothetical protein